MVADHVGDMTSLNNGVNMPWVGLGVYKTEDGEEVQNAVKYALQAGYRHIDTAAFYANEAGVGKALRTSAVKRDNVFVTTKLWNSEQGYESTLKAFEESRKKLGLDYVDLYLIHWPVHGKYKDTWRAFEKLYDDGLVRAIGVSNFQTHHLEDLLADAKIVPAVNQVECHPLLTQKELRQYCRSHNIQLEAWSPIMRGNLDSPVLAELARQYQRSAAQIVLRWHLQNEIVIIPKSVRQSRIVENADLFNFELTAADMAKIDGLNENHRLGPDPDSFGF